MKSFLHSLRMLLFFTVLCGVAYPLIITGVAQLTFPKQANGSLIVENGKVRGSSLIGQAFDAQKYFWGRPSATSPAYNASASSGSNFGPTSPALKEAIASRIKALRNADPSNDKPIPTDLVTTSGSGLDPHVSPAAAEFQVPRVARARGLAEDRVRQLVQNHTQGPRLGVLGEPVVNVLELNLALDREAAR
ncbi:MAG: potassium-transporting ATPase subunit KdpC [Fimbriimonadaceae bacterium]|nr:potassium-transporting ATPase subunit KdpC [Fimbriimonadaceae bacterium]QYK56706.1 MAG: potassium-transporting ATPase subunit KdpC [Fimbriimonadaceae bacterium]